MNEIYGFRFTALGCTGRIRVVGTTASEAQRVVIKAVRWLRQSEEKLSRFIPTSLVSRLNHGEAVAADGNLIELLALAEQTTQQTAGRFNATAAPLWKLWHDPQQTSWPSQAAIQEAINRCSDKIAVSDQGGVRLAKKGSIIDLGGIGKEWCVDQLVTMIKQEGIHHVMVELGGDCAAYGHQPDRDGWAVLLPGVAGAVILNNEAIATSGIGTRGRWLMGQWSPHLMDANTGMPASGVVASASVIASTCVVAGVHASDLCLLSDMSNVELMARHGNYPTWLRLQDGAWWTTPQTATRIYPVMGLAA